MHKILFVVLLNTKKWALRFNNLSVSTMHNITEKLLVSQIKFSAFFATFIGKIQKKSVRAQQKLP